MARVGGSLERARWVDLPLEASALIDRVRRRTGLEDFGGDDFSEPLERLLRACREEARLNFAGRLALVHEVEHLLENRLYLTDELRSRPAMGDAPVRSPVFITGLPRTGTTFLHDLLSRDQAWRVPRTWEVMYPSRRQGPEAFRQARTRWNLACFDRLAPGLSAAHPMGASRPQECIAMMSLSFLSDEFETMFDVPAYSGWLTGQDFRAAYDWHRRFLQHLQNGRSESWLLKAPAHLATFSSLLERYPDARIVQTHRAPAEVMQSLSSMAVMVRSAFTDGPLRESAHGELIRFWAEALRRFGEQRPRMAPGRVCDVGFSELQADPLGAARRIYDHFGLPLTAEAGARMREYVRKESGERRKRHRYPRMSFEMLPQDSLLFAEYSKEHGL